MSEENVEVVRRGFAAANRAAVERDALASYRDIYDLNAEYDAVEEEGLLRGPDEIVDYFRRWLDVWDDFHWEAEKLIDAGDQVVAFAALSGRAQASGLKVSQRMYYVIELRDLKVVRVREFVDRGKALKAAELSE